jgi:hypothetical protein
MRTLLSTRLAGAAATLVLLATAGAAHASATVIPFGGTSTFTDTTNDSCRGDLAGNVSGTVTLHGEVILQPSGELTFVDADHSVYRVDYVDGSYAIGSAAHHVTGTGVHGDGVATFSETNNYRLTVYDSAGQRLGTENGIYVTHVTVDLSTGITKADVGNFPQVCSI